MDIKHQRPPKEHRIQSSYYPPEPISYTMWHLQMNIPPKKIITGPQERLDRHVFDMKVYINNINNQ